MPKPHTYPTLYDDCLQLDISFLRKQGYLKLNQCKSYTHRWSRNGSPTGSILIKINTQSEQPYIELDYKYKGEARNYKVILVSMPSNLGKGLIWYFICPHTKKRCRKLYLIGGYFLHREAFKGCMYKIQIESKRSRQIIQKYKPMYKGNEYDQLKAKHFKHTYNGKPTKKYLRIIKKIEQSNALPDPLPKKQNIKLLSPLK